MLSVCMHTHTVNLGDSGIFHLKNSKNTKYIIKFLTAGKKEKRKSALREDGRVEI